LDGVRNDLKMDIARQTYGTGDGKITTCGVTSASNTVVLVNAEAIIKGELYVGQQVDIGTIAAPTTIAGGVNITDYSIANGTITVDGAAVTTTGSHFVFRAGNNGASTTAEMAGLRQLVPQAANTVGGINAAGAGNAYWDVQRTNVAGLLSLDNLTQAFNQVRVQGGQPSLMVSTFGLQRQLFNLLQDQVRYTEPLTLAGGFKAIEYMGQPFVGDRQAPFGSIFLLDERFIKVFTNNDWHFLDEDGNQLKWVVGFDAWEAVLARYMNLGISRRNVQYVLYGLTDANGV
jgi:hypothetical protein